MAPPRRAGAIKSFGLAGASPTAAPVGAEDTQGTGPSGDRAVVPSRSQPRTRPAARADTTVQFTVRLDPETNTRYLMTRLELQRMAGAKLLPDKSEVTRVLWDLLAADPVLQRRVLDDLG